MQPGIYTFYSAAAGRYLSCSGRSLRLSAKPLLWQVKHSGKNGFYVYAHNTELLLDIHNAWVTSGNTVKVWTHTGYDVQLWHMEKNPNGSYTILHSADPRYCLGFCGENAVLQLRNKNEPMQEWVMAREPLPYLSVWGKNRVVELQLPRDISLSAVRLQRWADRLETAYSSFQALTGFRPFENIAVEAYIPSPYPGYAGWAFPNSNIIHVAPDFLHGDLAKMNCRRTDWNFCVLHEMGHIFDFGKPWNFEAELMTDLKVAYVLEINGAAAAPAEFDAATCFYGADIAQAYARLGKDFSEEYDVFGCAKRFLDIKDQIGWEPFRQTFHYLQKKQAAYTNATALERLTLFTQTLSHFSGQNIRAYFSAGEWNAICRKIC